MVANFNLTAASAASGNGTGTPQKYVLQKIEFRKPAAVPEGTSQVLSHVLEAILVHKEVTGTGYYANILVPFDVVSEASLDIVAPLINQATLPQNVGDISPVLVSAKLPLNLAAAYENVSFQHFWAETETSCNHTKAPTRMFMRNASMAATIGGVDAVLAALKYAPDVPPVSPPVVTWLVEPCPRGAVCQPPAALNLSNALENATAIKAEDLKELNASKTAMDASLVALHTNISAGLLVTNQAYNTAIAAKANLQHAESSYESISKKVQQLQNFVNQAKAGDWDADAPSVTTTAAPSSLLASSASSARSAAVLAVPAKAALLTTKSSTEGCQTADIASPLEVDLAQHAEHVDVNTAGPSEALLFWRLSATPELAPAEAAAAETASKAPQLRVANLGDKLRVTPVPEGKPLFVMLVHGQELPVMFADVSVPAEHSINNQHATAEIQLIHRSQTDPSEAVALSLQLDEADDNEAGDNAWLQKVLSGLPRAGQFTELQGADPMSLHGALGRGVAGHFYRYDGRLMKSAPCMRVKWHVLEERGHVSRRQLAALTDVLRPPGSAEAFADPSALQPAVLAAQPHRSGSAFLSGGSFSVLQTTMQAVPTNSASEVSEAKPGNLRSLLQSLPRKRASEVQALVP
eukprot:TRINITY_DN108734_c0_g1_i1.p1 TRINITY_DN108734_c0_g1~~TRINITY_DN108734_c0_g1_i1.p1  ORF type:complete len:730 (+),score=161.20 TRINITY_DN108734_c0_g1_i1:284-2191(+)